VSIHGILIHQNLQKKGDKKRQRRIERVHQMKKLKILNITMRKQMLVWKRLRSGMLFLLKKSATRRRKKSTSNEGNRKVMSNIGLK